jgi:type IV pilus assembly protein PilX
MNHLQQQNGMVLVTVLIFLLILSMLAMSVFDASYLQIRMSQNFGDDIRLLQAAEIGLRTAEKQLQAGQLVHDDVTVIYSVEHLNATNCVWNEKHYKKSGIYYRITSQASWNEKEVALLQSTYAQATAQTCVNQQPAVQAGRMSWRELKIGSK